MIKKSTIVWYIVIIVFLFLGASDAYNLVSIKGLTDFDYNLTFLTGLLMTFWLNNTRRQKYCMLSKTFRIYYFLLVLSIIILLLYTVIVYQQQSFYLSLRVVSQYLLVIWAVPIYYLMKKDDTENKMMEIVNLLSVLWCLLLLIHSFIYNTTGIVLFDFIDSASSGIRNGMLRVSTGCLTNISLIYCFWKILNNEMKKKKYHVICFVIMLLAFVLVMQSRAYTVSMSAVFVVMILFDKNNNKSVLRKIILIFSIVLIALGTDYIQSYVNNIFTRYEISVTARTYGYNYYWSIFLDNPIFGFGLLKDQVHYSTIYSGPLGLAFLDDVGIVGQFASLGIFCVIIVIGFYYYLFKTYSKIKKSGGTNTLLIGLLSYVLFTSITLIVFNQQRVAAMAVIVALFEFYKNKTQVSDRLF